MNTFRSNREGDSRQWGDVQRTWGGDRSRSNGNTGRAHTPDFESSRWFRDSPGRTYTPDFESCRWSRDSPDGSYCTDPYRDLQRDPAPKRDPIVSDHVRDRHPPRSDTAVGNRELLRERYSPRTFRGPVRDREPLRDGYPRRERGPVMENETVWDNVRAPRDYPPRRGVKIPVERNPVAHSSREQVLESGREQNHQKPHSEKDLAAQGLERFINVLNKGVHIDRVGDGQNHHKPHSEKDLAAQGLERFINVLNKGVHIDRVRDGQNHHKLHSEKDLASEGFERFVNLLNKGVDIDRMSNIVNGVPTRGRELEPASHYRSESQGSHSMTLHEGHSRSQSEERRMDATQLDNQQSSLSSNEITGGRFGFRSTRSRSPALVSVAPEDKQQYGQMQSLLQTIGLDLGVEEVGKLTGRIQERLYGKRDTEKKGNQVNDATATTHPSPQPLKHPPGPPPNFYASSAASGHAHTYPQAPAAYPPYPPPPLPQGPGLQEPPVVAQYSAISQPTRWLQPIPQAPVVSGCNRKQYLRKIPAIKKPISTAMTTLREIPKQQEKGTVRELKKAQLQKKKHTDFKNREKHEGRSGYRTVQIIGIPEEVKISPSLFSGQVLCNLLNLSANALWCHAYRTPATPGKTPRVVILRFKTFRDKDSVMRSVHTGQELFYEGHRIHIIEDFGHEVNRQRAKLRSLMHELYVHGLQPALDDPTCPDPTKVVITRPSGEKYWLSSEEAQLLVEDLKSKSYL